MAYEPKPGSFSLFRNDRKEKDTHPDYRGDGMTLDGQPAWISAWLKESNGKKFFSISLQLKEQAGGRSSGGSGGGSREPVAGRGRDRSESWEAELDDSIPFLTPGDF